MSNWIEKAAEELAEDTRLAQGEMTTRKAAAKAIILSHAPVIDAEKLAKAIYEFADYELHQLQPELCANDILLTKKKLAQLITDSIDLRLDWVRPRFHKDTSQTRIAEYGEITLETWPFESEGKTYWSWGMKLGDSRGRGNKLKDGHKDTQALAQQAATNALRRIITGCK